MVSLFPGPSPMLPWSITCPTLLELVNANRPPPIDGREGCYERDPIRYSPVSWSRSAQAVRGGRPFSVYVARVCEDMMACVCRCWRIFGPRKGAFVAGWLGVLESCHLPCGQYCKPCLCERSGTTKGAWNCNYRESSYQHQFIQWIGDIGCRQRWSSTLVDERHHRSI